MKASEIERLEKLAVQRFLEKNYKDSIENSGFSLSAKNVNAIMDFLDVNQDQFALLIGCQKSKVSKILRKEQRMSKSQAMLAIERLGLEFVRPGACRQLLSLKSKSGAPSKKDQKNEDVINQIRFANAS